MKATNGFRDLLVWQEAKLLAVDTYRITEENFARDFALKGQMQKAAVSVASNIAEGYERGSDKEFVRFLLIAKGSLSELRTQFEIAMEIGYISQKICGEIEASASILAAKITKLIQYRNTESNQVE